MVMVATFMRVRNVMPEPAMVDTTDVTAAAPAN